MYPKYVSKEKLLDSLGEQITEDMLNRDMTYLEDKELVEVQWLLGRVGHGFVAKISPRGIDFLKGN